MVKEARPMGQTIAYAYDANGNLTQVTDALGQIKKYTYDDVNRRIKEDHYTPNNSTTAVKSISYTYNTLDRLTGYSDGATSATYTYDAKQLRQTGESINYGGFTLATGTTHNALGQKTAITYPDGATYSYTFDANNQLSTVGLPTGYGSITVNSYQWTVPAQITLPGGTVRTQQYDGLLRLKNLSVKDPGQSQVMNYQYGYDLTGNIVTKATEQGNTAYTYDTVDRLTGAAYTAQTGTPRTNETYAYDPVANRTSDATTTGYSYNANNQLTQAGSVSYTYDANGNTLSQTDASNPANTRSYVYDTDNRLIEVHDAGNAIVATYSYDPFGRRLSKTVANQTTHYLYAEEGLIAEADATGQITRTYGYAPNTTYGTQPLFMRVGTAYYTYQTDHLGTPMKLLNQSGVTVWSATYDAYGNATVDPNSSITNNLRFPGQYADQETGLYYNWNRYYDPSKGRYTTSDPIGLSGGINEYIYVEDDPLLYSDPLGLRGGPGIPGWGGRHLPAPPSPKVKPANPCKIDLKKLVENAKRHASDSNGVKKDYTQAHGQCAGTVRKDIVEAGGDRLPGLGDAPNNYPTPDKWGPPLIKSGCYKLVSDPYYKPQPGDIAITKGDGTGHISIYDGDTWDADFGSPNPSPGSTGKYKDAVPTIYQFVGKR